MAVVSLDQARRRRRFGGLTDCELMMMGRGLQAEGHRADIAGEGTRAVSHLHLAAECYMAIGEAERFEMCRALIEAIQRDGPRGVRGADFFNHNGVICR